MKKYIHYCWFGGKPLPKLAKKCIKSWKKYLPDYEIIEWNESNTDLDECKFVREAYDNKKWAFVADYARTKALYEKGGIYFDTDMEITKDISHLFKNDTFLGIEDSGYVAVGVWYEKKSKSFLASNLLEFYRKLPGFNVEDMYSNSIPKIITKHLYECGFEMGKNSVQILKNDIAIYPRDYFYPLSYDRQNNIFTDNTCMIHYYDATWVPKAEKRTNRIIKLLGRERGIKFIKYLSKTKHVLKSIAKIFLFPIVIVRNKKRKNSYIKECIELLDKSLKDNNKQSALVFYRIDWLGTANITKETFNNTVGIKELFFDELIDYYAKKICDANLDMIVFSAFDLTWFKLVRKIKEINSKQNIKVIWHGSNAVNTEYFDWKVLKQLLEYNKKGLINTLTFVKKSMYDFYYEKGYKCEFLMNTLTIDNKDDYILKEPFNDGLVRIGVYASGDRWVKNFYNQLSAASMIKNHLIDCIPVSPKTRKFAELIDANVVGVSKPIPREELLKRIAKNDINIYVTFVECAPLLPLESMELGVPCITSNNHHYWEGTELEEYLIVNSPDNIIEIKNKIEFVLKNRDKIMELYRIWKKKYDAECKKNLRGFFDEK